MLESSSVHFTAAGLLNSEFSFGLCMGTDLVLTPQDRMPRGSAWFWWGEESLLQKLGQMCSAWDISHHVSFKAGRGSA